MYKYAGNVVDSMSYTPFGQRRMYSDWSKTDTAKHLIDRGFTGQQHLDKFALINFNGRMYDPVLAHFLSPDPYIQNPENPLNYNRYSYCLFSPLQYVDPSGFFVDWVQDIDGNIYWDQFATSQATTKNGEKYLGKEGYGIDEETGLLVHYKSDGTIEKNLLNFLNIAITHNSEIGGNSISIYGDAINTSLAIGASELGIGSNVFYNDISGKWLGKNGKFYNTSWGGNGSTGGKLKFAQNISTQLKTIGKAIGGFSTLLSGYNLSQAKTFNEQIMATTELLTDAISYTPCIGPYFSLYWNLGGRQLHWSWYQNVLMPQIEMGINPGLMIYQPFK